MPQLLLRRQGHHQSAGEVLGEPADLIGKTRDVMLAHIGQHLIRQIDTRFHRRALIARRNAGAIDCLVKMGHLDQLVTDVGDTLDSIIVSDRGGGANQYVSDAGFADIASPVIAGETLDQCRGGFDFAVHEDALVRDEDVFEDDHRFLAGKLRIAGVDVTVLGTARVAGLPAVNVGDPLGINRHGAGNGIFLVSRP